MIVISPKITCSRRLRGETNVKKYLEHMTVKEARCPVQVTSESARFL